ncbi:ECH_1013 family putative transcriptional regulator [Candidatus Neoehrlichia procyonis]|uniref:Helix-turn-helix family protein n=1 Tax=Candidatus Neoehrlichia procyonis str. RAC413 TaxID=1359163 RepID=A0A0F3NP77_9RICK|nr:LexA family transcriptional regulator [Candidatus Neoehrlichia lotoris]KJV69512.1 helix-turn-helix family protein [Candidatus Neoehrlichia lotoris str. RAC413]
MERHDNHGTIVTKIKLQMDKMGINARELADRASVGKSFVYDILSGKSTNPTSKKLMAIAKVLKVPLSYLISSDNCTYDMSGNDIFPIHHLDVQNSLSEHSNNFKFYLPADIKLPLDIKNLRFYHVKGDSMWPTLVNQDIVLVDTGDKIAHPVGIFTIIDSVGISIRRLEYVKDNQKIRLRIVCDNKQYSSYESDLEDVKVLGRVVWYARAL